MWFHRNRKTVSILFRPTLSGTPQKTRSTSDVGCCRYARSCDSGVIERKSPEQGPRGKDRYGTITNPNPAGRVARGKAPRSPCIALRPRFGGASFLRPIQIGHDGYQSMGQRLSHDGACFYWRVSRWLKTASFYKKFSPRRLLNEPTPARYGVRCAGCSYAPASPAGRRASGAALARA